jgi:hypothetical protein
VDAFINEGAYCPDSCSEIPDGGKLLRKPDGWGAIVDEA